MVVMAHKTSTTFNDAFEDINLAEQRRHRQMGFTCGYSVGEEAGWRDGYIFGMRKGAQLSAEIGYYQGFAHAWISILEHEDTNKQRKLNALHSLLEMTRSFPRTNNILADDTVQKLARIRAKFKQVNALILGTGATSTTFFSSSFSGGGGGAGGGGGSAAGQAPTGPTASQGAHHHHTHAPHIGGIYNRGGGTSCTSQESGVGTSSFRGISPTAYNNNISATPCPHHHHHHQTPPPPNVEMSF
ncbi:Oral cancer-overexpressed protein 1 [Dermatophagoides farinae]|uniref:Oral cancer-overexpressed protein 1 n=1 Tax=Dermatophagoides farinae TaxID=6954 RepID=A0A922I484_DERFA|nr:Oral cancer-overexpressed protein 1 [Dermatophagoides farinae]